MSGPAGIRLQSVLSGRTEIFLSDAPLTLARLKCLILGFNACAGACSNNDILGGFVAQSRVKGFGFSFFVGRGLQEI